MSDRPSVAPSEPPVAPEELDRLRGPLGAQWAALMARREALFGLEGEVGTEARRTVRDDIAMWAVRNVPALLSERDALASKLAEAEARCRDAANAIERWADEPDITIEEGGVVGSCSATIETTVLRLIAQELRGPSPPLVSSPGDGTAG